MSRTLWTSSLRTIFVGLVSPVGCLDKVSGALFFTPGTWTIKFLKRYRKVFSFRLILSLVLVMLSRDLSPNTLRSGLWSTAIVRFSHPRTRCLASSRASATASAYPSIGAYIPGFGSVSGSATDQGDLSALFAAEKVVGGARAVLLEQPVTNTLKR